MRQRADMEPSYLVVSTENFWMCSECGALLALPSLPIHRAWHMPEYTLPRDYTPGPQAGSVG